MQRFEIVHEFDGRPDQFWELFFDESFSRAFYGAVDLEFEVVSETKSDEKIERVVRYRSTQPVPAVLKPFFKNGFGYTEHATFDKQTQRLEHRIEPSAFPDKTDIRGKMVVEAVSDGRMRRSYTGTVTVKMPLVGGKIEASAIDGMKRSNDIGAKVTSQWLGKRASAV